MVFTNDRITFSAVLIFPALFGWLLRGLGLFAVARNPVPHKPLASPVFASAVLDCPHGFDLGRAVLRLL